MIVELHTSVLRPEHYSFNQNYVFAVFLLFFFVGLFVFGGFQFCFRSRAVSEGAAMAGKVD